MIKIGLLKLEPKYTNLALEKIRVWWKSHGVIAEYCSPLESVNYDQVYCSSLFNWTNKKYVTPQMITGGTGFDITTKLPPEIDAVEPHINMGFTTRGCPNNCSFCVVRLKEGEFKIVCTILELWDGKAKCIVCLDNNILASPEHFATNAELARKHNLTLDYNQGLDHRRLTPEIVDIMKSFRHKEFRFAFDNPKSINTVEKAIDLLQSKGIKRSLWYVLCGYDTSLEEDLFRVNYLRERGQNAYVQRYRTPDNKPSPKLILLAEWVNQHHIFHGMTWNEFLNHPKNVMRKQDIIPKHTSWFSDN